MLEELQYLVGQAARGQDNINAGAFGSNGYGFVFKDLTASKGSYIVSLGSSKLVAFNIKAELTYLSRVSKSSSLEEMLTPEDLCALIYAGKLKSLLPSLKLGGYERLFKSWFFAETPKAQTFPGTFYYGPSGLAIGGWHSEDYKAYEQFRPEFLGIINFSPFSMNTKELIDFCDAMKMALDKIPIADYYAQFSHDWGTTLMGVKQGKPFMYEIGKRRTKAFLTKYYNNI